MIFKGIAMAGIILLALGLSLIVSSSANVSNAVEDLLEDATVYDSSTGPDNPLYGLKLAFENIDESFTQNVTDKLSKKISHSRLRIAEGEVELKNKNEEAAQKAFEHYKEKTKETEIFMSDIKEEDHGILNVQKMSEKNQYALEQLLESHPENIGLKAAYNKSIELKEKFEEKTDIKLERVVTNEGIQILKEIKKEVSEDIEDKDNKENVENDSKDFETVKIKARVSSNKTNIEIGLKFETNSTDNATISKEIQNKLKFGKDNISNLIEIKYDDQDDFKNILDADAQIRMNVSKIFFQYKFILDKTNKTDIIDGIIKNLSGITQADIRNNLEITHGIEEKEMKKEETKKIQEIEKQENEDKTEINYSWNQINITGNKTDNNFAAQETVQETGGSNEEEEWNNYAEQIITRQNEAEENDSNSSEQKIAGHDEAEENDSNSSEQKIAGHDEAGENNSNSSEQKIAGQEEVGEKYSNSSEQKIAGQEEVGEKYSNSSEQEITGQDEVGEKYSNSSEQEITGQDEVGETQTNHIEDEINITGIETENYIGHKIKINRPEKEKENNYTEAGINITGNETDNNSYLMHNYLAYTMN